MSSFGSYLFVAALLRLSDVRAVISRSADVESEFGQIVDVEDWEVGPRAAVLFSREEIIGWYDGHPGAPLAIDTLVENLATEVGAPAAAVWSDNGQYGAGCLSGNANEPPLIGFGFGEPAEIEEEEGEEFGLELLRTLQYRWGEDWVTGAVPAITQWVRHLNPDATAEDVRHVLTDDYGDAGRDGLYALMELTGRARPDTEK